jgi:peptidyl-prolyl cis-trans isomerase B (cyclophilin B)
LEGRVPLPSLSLLALLPVLSPEPIPVRAGLPVRLDGRIEEAEWADAAVATGKMTRLRKYPDVDRTVTLRWKRTGPWLAVAIHGEKQYDGETVRLLVCEEAGAYVTALVLAIGNAAFPPVVWRRGPAAAIDRVVPEPARCALARVDVGREEEWAAEYLILLRGLGIGRGDARRFKAMVTVTHAENGDYLSLPSGATDLRDTSTYAPLVSEDDWGREESWAEPGEAASREFDDQELLHRLFLEYAHVSQRIAPDLLVISDAVRARSMTKIDALRRQLEAGERRNPTLPAWRYYLARLLHEGNLHADARTALLAIPRTLFTQEAVATLAVEHYLDVQELERAEEVLRAWPNPATMKEPRFSVARLRAALEAEAQALEADGRKAERNPVVRLETAKGPVVCELFEDDAPHAVRNFMNLVLVDRYYDGMRFHVVLGGFAARVGDPRSRAGMAGELDGPEWRLVQNHSKRPMLRGRLSMVPVERGILHGSQFVITVAPLLRDEEDAEVFGRVIEGMDAVDALEQGDELRRIVVVEQRRHPYEPRGRVR